MIEIMADTFVSKKFLPLLVANTVAMLAEYLCILANNLIIGNMLGEAALSAATLCLPFFSLQVFAAFLFSIGTSIVVSYERAAGDEEAANGYFSLGIILACGLGALLTALFFGIHAALPFFFRVPEEVQVHLAGYFFYFCLLPAPLLLGILFYNILLNEGGENHAIAATVLQLVLGVGLSLLLTPRMGIAGVGLATLVANTAGTGVLASFFWTKRNPFRFRRFFRWDAVWRVAKFSAVDASLYLYTFLMPLCLNYFLLARFGTDGVVVFTVVFNVLLLMLAGFDGVGEAIQPFISVYRAENCQTGIRKTMDLGKRAAWWEGLVLAAILLVFADYVPGMFGIATPGLVEEAALAVRILAFSSVAFSLLLLDLSYLLYMERVFFPSLIVMLQNLLLPLALGIGLGLAFGPRGVWVGIGVSGIAALWVCRAAAARLYGKGPLPLLDPERFGRELSYDAPKTPAGIDGLVARAERDLVERGVDREKITRILMMIDSTEMYAMDAEGEKNVVVECNILLDDPITVILRDSGDKNDILEEGAAAARLDGEETSLRDVCGAILGTHRGRRHGLTLGKNRSLFRF